MLEVAEQTTAVDEIQPGTDTPRPQKYTIPEDAREEIAALSKVEDTLIVRRKCSGARLNKHIQAGDDDQAIAEHKIGEGLADQQRAASDAMWDRIRAAVPEIGNGKKFHVNLTDWVLEPKKGGFSFSMPSED